MFTDCCMLCVCTVGVNILADSLLLSTFPEEEIEESKSVIAWQFHELPGNILSRDAAQIAAYKNSPLSHDHYCPAERVPSLNAEMIKKFKKEQFFAKNCVIAGAGKLLLHMFCNECLYPSQYTRNSSDINNTSYDNGQTLTMPHLYAHIMLN